MVNKRDALRGKTATEAVCEPQPHEVWDAAVTGLDIELVIFYVDCCINRKRMSLPETDDYINGRICVDDIQHFIRLNYLNKHHIEVYYMYEGTKCGFECAVKGLTQLRKDIQRTRRNNNVKT